MGGNAFIRRKLAEKSPDPEESLTSWRIRCLKCDCTQLRDQFGIRPTAAGLDRTVIHCPRCGCIRRHVIEKTPAAEI